MRTQYSLDDDEFEQFWSLVDRSGGSDACWEWQGGSRHSYGYGLFYLRSLRNSVGAHRLAAFLSIGPLPNGEMVCHDCDNPPCCNPSHLFLGTQMENIHDMMAKGRHPRAAAWHPQGVVNNKAKLNDDQVIDARRRYGRGGVSKSALAREYGVTSTMMSWIITGKYWKHLPSVEELSAHHEPPEPGNTG